MATKRRLKQELIESGVVKSRNDKKEVYKRVKNRTDLTIYLTHLTKPSRQDGIDSPIKVLLQILRERTIKGSSRTIIGQNEVVCFQEAPIISIAQNAFFETTYDKAGEYYPVPKDPKADLSYFPYGISFEKSLVWRYGGRPVIYDQSETAKTYICENEWWRIVNLDLANIEGGVVKDWTHEREWRIKGDFQFGLEDVFVLLPDENAYSRFVEQIETEILKKIRGMILLGPLLY